MLVCKLINPNPKPVLRPQNLHRPRHSSLQWANLLHQKGKPKQKFVTCQINQWPSQVLLDNTVAGFGQFEGPVDISGQHTVFLGVGQLALDE